MSADAVARRYRVLDLRIRLERAAMTAYVTVCAPSQPVRPGRIPARLPFLVGLVEPSRRPTAHRLTRLARHVYARTSDVLHGRTTALDVPDVVVDEWAIVVDEVEAIVRAAHRPVRRARGSGTGSRTAGRSPRGRHP